MNTGVSRGPALDVANLAVQFRTSRGLVKALDDVTFDVQRGEIAGLIGETGCGKTVTAYAILRLIRPPGRIVRGRIEVMGRNVLQMTEAEVRHLRGKHVGMIFQRPMSSLNPMFSIGAQFMEIIRCNRAVGRRRARDIAVESLAAVGLPAPHIIVGQRPFELSGGMQQRVMIAFALACEVEVLLADEPTTALDVSIQLQILKLIKRIVRECGLSVLLISHDMSVIGSMCDRVNVMYAGAIIESGPHAAIIGCPAHPYTQGLLRAVPEMARLRGARLEAIKGTVPSLIDPPDGCRFAERCEIISEECLRVVPLRVAIGPDHYVNCHRLGRDKRRTDGEEQADEDSGNVPTGRRRENHAC